MEEDSKLYFLGFEFLLFIASGRLFLLLGREEDPLFIADWLEDIIVNNWFT